jgi:hypothetical protein
MIEKYINDYDKECYRGVEASTPFSELEFNLVKPDTEYSLTPYCDEPDVQFALHTNIGSLTVLNRMTGFGWRDTETGYRDMDKKFWLASGDYDVRDSGAETMGEAIEWVKKHANNCIGI